jgi:YesN/AraC family two-component response regulator
MSSPLSSRELLELGERIGISPKSQKYLDEYYSSIPVIQEHDGLMAMIDTFCEHIWGSTSFAIVDVNKQHKLPESPITEATHGESFDDILVNMKAMEKRYEFENEMIRAVSLGQMHKESLFSGSFSENLFEKRVADPIRNSKNYCIIMNTLLRKAAEQGGAHPLYIDRVSSEFAAKIEQISSLFESSVLMKDMFRSYCRLVRKHSMQKYSPVVQKTILVIDSDLSADLSLSSLAESQGISSGYLSTVFKKETGKTVSEYIRDKRIKHAAHLLGTTHLQIQTVALHCGIMDVQYFSKLFKKATGMTPKEYREIHKQ